MTSAILPADWSLSGLDATCRSTGPAVRLSLAEPGTGLAVDGDRLLGVDFAAACDPSDQWVRGADVVAVYEPADARHLRGTVMWRHEPSAAGRNAWQAIVSAQTALLDADPAIAVVSEVEAGDVLMMSRKQADGWRPLGRDAPLPTDAIAILVRRAARGSVLIAVHPDDEARLGIDRSAGRVRAVCGLFPRPLEKGVLLRSRTLAAVGPADDDTGWAGATLAAFAAAPPPLTT